jgi:hypothetical protein
LEVPVEQMPYCSISPNIMQEKVFQKAISKYLYSLIELAKESIFFFSFQLQQKQNAFAMNNC